MFACMQFVLAGDNLVHHCPTWQWSAGEGLPAKSYLPPDKQFLVTRNVPCYKRCKDMEYSMEHEKVLEEEGDEDGGWVDTHHYADGTSSGLAEQVQDMTLEPSVSGCAFPNSILKAYRQQQLSGNVLDIRLRHFRATFVKKTEAVEKTTAAGGDSQPGSLDGAIVSTRTYDLNITYDNYYRTPRLWLYGYDEKRQPLSMEAMYEDISQDHAKKTVTMEAHPHLPGPPMASVHPCRHAEVIEEDHPDCD
ncbi:hypothetical protein HPB49_022504 [Dermacentor silvarum]|uniref:Uncharacterized protein n=1 Tax=Dermacentor silvarum TaxID=543639 RepID=A0ACB8DG19_DERSI|nr:hypothetical protein HPB49_022504 [Dermacentor silvarum]